MDIFKNVFFLALRILKYFNIAICKIAFQSIQHRELPTQSASFSCLNHHSTIPLFHIHFWFYLSHNFIGDSSRLGYIFLNIFIKLLFLLVDTSTSELSVMVK